VVGRFADTIVGCARLLPSTFPFAYHAGMDAQAVAGALQVRKLAEAEEVELSSRIAEHHDKLGHHQTQAIKYRERIDRDTRKLLELRAWLHTAEEG
jgi:hypothetical protein